MTDSANGARVKVGDRIGVIFARQAALGPMLRGFRVEHYEREGQVTAVHDNGCVTVRWFDDPSSLQDVHSYRVIARPNAPGG